MNTTLETSNSALGIIIDRPQERTFVCINDEHYNYDGTASVQIVEGLKAVEELGWHLGVAYDIYKDPDDKVKIEHMNVGDIILGDENGVMLMRIV